MFPWDVCCLAAPPAAFVHVSSSISLQLSINWCCWFYKPFLSNDAQNSFLFFILKYQIYAYWVIDKFVCCFILQMWCWNWVTEDLVAVSCWLCNPYYVVQILVLWWASALSDHQAKPNQNITVYEDNTWGTSSKERSKGHYYGFQTLNETLYREETLFFHFILLLEFFFDSLLAEDCSGFPPPIEGRNLHIPGFDQLFVRLPRQVRQYEKNNWCYTKIWAQPR